MATLSYFDVSGVQRYLFNTGRLRDVVSGSDLASAALSEQSLMASGASKILFASGGNALVRHVDVGQAEQVTTSLTRRLLETSPGLDIRVAHLDETGNFASDYEKLLALVARSKTVPRWSSPLDRLPMVAPCDDSPEAGAELHFAHDRYSVLGQDTALRRSRRTADWFALLGLPTVIDAGGTEFQLRFPLDLDDLGRERGSESRLAVVHIDGNRIGAAIQAALNGAANPEDTLVQISGELTGLFTGALQHIVRRMVDSIVMAAEHRPSLPSERSGRTVKLSMTENAVWLPVRPIVAAGDDLTLVCDARFSWWLTRLALEYLESVDVPSLGGPIGAAAGIAIGPSHSDFHSLYMMADHLTQSAKQRCGAGCNYALDWHVSNEPGTTDVESVRSRSVVPHQHGTLRATLRPYRLEDFQAIDDQVLGDARLSQRSEGLWTQWWTSRHGKLRGDLVAALTKGPSSVDALLHGWREWNSPKAGPEPVFLSRSQGTDFLSYAAGPNQTTGYGPQGTVLLDALELATLHYPVEGTTPVADNTPKGAED